MTLAFHEPEPTLAPVEADRLQSLEATIAAGLQTFHEVGSALLEIRDSRLYRQTHATFEDYCRERWGMERAHAYRLIEASEVVSRLSPIGDMAVPANEGQARALGQFDQELRPVVMRATKAHADATGKPITAGLIEGVGRVLTEATTTGHVDIGDGTSTPILAAIVAESFEHTQRQSQHIRDHYEEHEANGARKPHVAQNTGNNEWYTPPEYTEAARRVMGGIDTDPASTETANLLVKAERFYTAEDDGLTRAWTGRVWLNPPYSSDLVGRFAAKLLDEISDGNTIEAIILVNNATETSWFQSLAWKAASVCFPKGRIKYLDPTGTPQLSPLQGQAFMYFGPNADVFQAEFSVFGVTL